MILLNKKEGNFVGAIIRFIATYMGMALRFFYDRTLNYGVAIILFTIFIKLVLIPLTYKQQKSLKESQELQPILTEIQKKYKDEPEKQQQELMKVYQERKINPMGGCLLMLIQFPIIISMFYAVAQPITYMFPEELQKSEVTSAIEKYVGDNGRQNTYKEVFYISNEREDLLNTKFLGLDLAQVPNSDKGNIILWIIPILSALTTYLTSKISISQTKQNAGKNEEASEQAVKMQKNMSFFLPLMTGYIAFIVPLGMGLYWMVNNVTTLLVQIGIMKIMNKPVEKV